ncbi:MAG TPA: hypothetical protein VNM40_00485 [Candidatus Paceibacterota bacterium]|nr:hypothetical protein [Candidatus Paceibacterota bacterium]
MAKPYDPRQIGRALGFGGEHLVLSYGSAHVIKFSFHVAISGASAVKKKIADYEHAQRHFAPYVVPTEIRAWDDGRKAVAIQERVRGRYLRVSDLLRDRIREQALDILERNARMHAESGLAFDLFGFHGLMTWLGRHSMSNVLVTDEDRLVIVDFATMHLVPRWYEWPLYLFVKWAKKRQERLLEDHWQPVFRRLAANSGIATDAPTPRVGLYAWGGPGTIDLLRVKYHRPSIDEGSFLELYSPKFLAAAREKLGATDLWMTYSWGFSDATEEAHRRHTRERIEDAKRLGFTTYGYVQGFNVVTDEFRGRDIFCRSLLGFRLPYSKGRHFICPNNPEARALVLDRVRAAAEEDFDNVYMDNIVFGMPPFYVSRQFVSSFGCHCKHCASAFRTAYGYPLPAIAAPGSGAFRDVLAFRAECTAQVIRSASEISRKKGKGFGVNLYDPHLHTTELYFGYDFGRIKDSLDYYVIENHAISLDRTQINNAHLESFIRDAEKPVFVVSYRRGIGMDEAYEQQEIDLIFSESAALGYVPCLKSSEFVTRGRWHALNIEDVRPPRHLSLERSEPYAPQPMPHRPVSAWAARLVDPIAPKCIDLAHHNAFLFYILTKSSVYSSIIRTNRRFEFDHTPSP